MSEAKEVEPKRNGEWEQREGVAAGHHCAS